MYKVTMTNEQGAEMAPLYYPEIDSVIEAIVNEFGDTKPQLRIEHFPNVFTVFYTRKSSGDRNVNDLDMREVVQLSNQTRTVEIFQSREQAEHFVKSLKGQPNVDTTWKGRQAVVIAPPGMNNLFGVTYERLNIDIENFDTEAK